MAIVTTFACKTWDRSSLLMEINVIVGWKNEIDENCNKKLEIKRLNSTNNKNTRR